MTPSKLEPLNLGSIARGATLELFEKAVTKVAENIADTDTDAEATREITLTFKIKPESDRRTLKVITAAKVKLAAVAEHKSLAYIGKDNAGHAYLFDQDPRQEMLFEPPEKDENLLTFSNGKTTS